jgi:glyoxylase-like metal-dependent hydrolase (beta-lactamase superfamily II)
VSRRRVQVNLIAVGRCRHPEWVTLRGGRFGPVDFPAYCALILHPSAGPILYDTGYSDRFREATEGFPARLYRWLTPVRLRSEERLEAQLGRHGLRPEDVRTVVVSHLHADHVSGLRDLPRARFVALRQEVEATLGRRGLGAVRRGFLPDLLPPDFVERLDAADQRPLVDLGPRFGAFPRGFDLLGDRSLVGVPLPGHTAGQLGLLLADEQDRDLLLAGDACWSGRAWREQRPPSWLARPLMHDWRRYLETLRGLKTLAETNPELHIVPSHCEASARTLAGHGPH